MAKADHLEFWSSAVKGKEKSEEEWRNILKDYGAGVDTPLCLFVKELMVTAVISILLNLKAWQYWPACFLTWDSFNNVPLLACFAAN